MNKKKTYIDKIALVDIKDKKVLFALTKGQDAWFQPGGKREHGETDEQALIREIKEELSVDINPQTIEYYGTFEAQAYGKPEGVKVRVTCYSATYVGDIRPNNEIEKFAYFSYNQVPKTSVTGQMVLDDLKSKGLIE